MILYFLDGGESYWMLYNFLCVYLLLMKLVLCYVPLIFCQGSLKTVEAFQRPRSGINGLISSFVKLLQVGIPWMYLFVKLRQQSLSSTVKIIEKNMLRLR